VVSEKLKIGYPIENMYFMYLPQVSHWIPSSSNILLGLHSCIRLSSIRRNTSRLLYPFSSQSLSTIQERSIIMSSHNLDNHEEKFQQYDSFFVSSHSPFLPCRKCHGEGKVKQRRRSKKSRPNDPTIPTASFTICTTCQGSGLIRQDEFDINTTLTSLPSSLPTVAIIGGGIGGLALGLACWHRRIPFVVFERDKSFSQRHQGYGLTLQQASKALKGFGIQSLMNGITSTRHVVYTPNGDLVGEWGLRKWGRKQNTGRQDPKRQNVHIARQALRKQLLDSLQNQVQWDCRLMSMNENEENVELTFLRSNGTEIKTQAEYVVGADGIRSTVRSLLFPTTDQQQQVTTPLRYLGCVVVLGICPLDSLDSSVTATTDLLDGHTVFQTADGTTRLYAMPYSETEYMWQLSFPIPQESDAVALTHQCRWLDVALEKCANWHTPIPELLQATPVSLITGYPVYDRPALLESHFQNAQRSSSSSSSPRRITLLGDAAQ
jgi:salicylate hydroxylase